MWTTPEWAPSESRSATDFLPMQSIWITSTVESSARLPVKLSRSESARRMAARISCTSKGLRMSWRQPNACARSLMPLTSNAVMMITRVARGLHRDPGEQVHPALLGEVDVGDEHVDR